MRSTRPTGLICALGATMLAMSCSVWGRAAIDPELETELNRRAPHEELSVIVSLRGKVDKRRYETQDRRRRDTRLVRALKRHGAAERESHQAFLRERGARGLRELWAGNSIALAARAGVERISPDSMLQAPPVNYGSPAPAGWNLGAVSAPDMWALGYTGAGVVVANMDTGVDPNHPDLAGKWRAGGWFDPHGEHAVPYDSTGHGTQTMSLMVGDSVGVAPDARWIAAKLYDDAGWARYSDIHLVFQWLLDPDGDPATLDAPDIVNASWGLAGSAGQCITEFSNDIDALKAAGIAVTFAAGNDGPAPLTSLSPGNNLSGFASGAVDPSLAVASFSARGESACDGTVYPKLAAPGSNVNAADLSFGGMPMYAAVSGTSYAAPHTAGAMALLLDAYPDVGVAELESALTQGAQDLGVAGADNSYGHGLVNALAAWRVLLARLGSPPAITSTPSLAAIQNKSWAYKVTASDTDGGPLRFSLDQAPAGMSIKTTSDYIAWIGWFPTNAQVGVQDVTVRVTDPNGLYTTQTFRVAVENVNDRPLARNDAYTAIKGGVLNVAAPGVLANDSDPDAGDTIAATNYTTPVVGTLVGNADGSFSYTPPSDFTGMAKFAYLARDASGLSSKAAGFVAIAVRANRAPATVDDAALTTPDGPLTINVLGNDSDPDTAIDPANRIDPATLFIPFSGKPDRGGTAITNADGTIAYTPAPGFTGVETFTYAVKDSYVTPAISRAASVRVEVR